MKLTFLYVYIYRNELSIGRLLSNPTKIKIETMFIKFKKYTRKVCKSRSKKCAASR